MALIEFQNNTSPYLNAENLNNNFNYLDEKTQNIYSTTETIIGTYNGKTLYAKIIEFGALPNSGTKSVAHNISNLKDVVDLIGHFKNNENVRFVVPYVYPNPNFLVYSICFSETTDTQINISTGTDRSSYSGYVIIKYTKTTDEGDE